MDYQTIKVDLQGTICHLQIHRPEANNTINDLLINELSHALQRCEDSVTVVVLKGLAEVFCFGADFQGIHDEMKSSNGPRSSTSEPLYNLWLKLSTGPYITVAYVRGKANAGGIGFVAACDLVLADETAVFSLSELLFGLYPACVMPFLIKRIGYQKAHYLTVMTKTVDSKQALEWGMIDALDSRGDRLLNLHLRRLQCLSKSSIREYKEYMSGFSQILHDSKYSALSANASMFSNNDNLQGITHYVETGQFPWERSW